MVYSLLQRLFVEVLDHGAHHSRIRTTVSVGLRGEVAVQKGKSRHLVYFIGVRIVYNKALRARLI